MICERHEMNDNAIFSVEKTNVTLSNAMWEMNVNRLNILVERIPSLVYSFNFFFDFCVNNVSIFILCYYS